jgi:hypothetical protein
MCSFKKKQKNYTFMKNHLSLSLVILSTMFLSCENDNTIIEEQDSKSLIETTTVSRTQNETPLPNRFQYFYPGRNTNKKKSKLYSSHSSSGTAGWTGDFTISNGTKTATKVGTAQLGSRIFLAHRGRTSNKLYCATSTNGSSFGRNYRISNSESKGYPELVEFNGKIWVYHRGVSSSRIYASSTSNGINWTNSRNISVSTGYNNYSLIAEDNPDYDPERPISSSNKKHLRLHLFTEGSYVYHYSSTDGINFSSRQTIPGTYRHSDGIYSVTSAKLGSRYFIAFSDDIDNSGDLSQVRIFSTENFTNFSGVTTISVNGGRVFTDTDLSMASSGNRLVLAYKEARGERIYTSTSTDGINWSGNRPAKGSTKSGVELIYTK